MYYSNYDSLKYILWRRSRPSPWTFPLVAVFQGQCGVSPLHSHYSSVWFLSYQVSYCVLWTMAENVLEEFSYKRRKNSSYAQRQGFWTILNQNLQKVTDKFNFLYKEYCSLRKRITMKRHKSRSCIHCHCWSNLIINIPVTFRTK